MNKASEHINLAGVPLPHDQTVNLDGERDRIVAEVMSMRARAQAELGPVRRSLRLDHALRSDHCDREPTVLRRPDGPSDVVPGPEGVDPFNGADLGRGGPGGAELRRPCAHPGVEERKMLRVQIAQGGAHRYERERYVTRDLAQPPLRTQIAQQIRADYGALAVRHDDDARVAALPEIGEQRGVAREHARPGGLAIGRVAEIVVDVEHRVDSQA